jgi:two-component system, NtrC family, response regulator AtoC
MKPPFVAIADDDLAFANYLKTFLDGRGYQSRIYSHGEDLLAAAHLGELPDVVLLDVMMSGMDGIATLRSLKAARADLQVIMISGRVSAPTIVEAIRLGAVSYVVKPDDPDALGEVALEAALNQAIEKRQLVSEVTELRRQVNDDQVRTFLWEKSVTMRDIATMVDRVADNDVTVLIRGESGVGKELVARAIHDRSARCARPFVKVNCAALPDDLLESELFGHEKGAFTGAATMRLGKFEHADGGTIMLDEIGEMKGGLQAKLLHVLQDGAFSRLGGNKRVTVDVRIVAATNRDLEAMLDQSEFREDLYYRLKVIEIVVPPLRQRHDEIPELIEFFIRKYSKRYSRPEPPLAPSLLAALQNYSWPGNIRELENVMKRFVILQDEALLLRDLRSADPRAHAPALRADERATLPGAPASRTTVAGDEASPRPGPGQAAAGMKQTSSTFPMGSLAEVARLAMVRAERDLIVPTLRRVNWNRRKAAPLLGVSYKTLLNKIKEHGIVQG